MEPEQDAADHGSRPAKNTNGNLGRLKVAGAVLTALGVALFAYFIYTVGLDDLIALDKQEYADKAAALAGDLAALRHYRDNLRGRMQASPLMDCAGFARGIEMVFRQMWEKWCLQGEQNERA